MSHASIGLHIMLENLSGKLQGVIKSLRGHARLTEDNIADAMREVRMALLEADVALPVVKDFIAQVKARAQGKEVLQSLTPGQAVIQVVHEELTKLMGAESVALNLAAVPPAIILMAGLQGSGKTPPPNWPNCSRNKKRKCCWPVPMYIAPPPLSNCAPWPKVWT